MLVNDKIIEKKVYKRILWADMLRIFAILGVVVLHSAAPVLYSLGKISTNRWLTAHLFDSVTRASVPLFVMISGMMLLNPAKEESLKAFFMKRFKKVLLPFVFWGIIYLLWKSAVTHTAFSPLQLLKEFALGPIYYHFWFIYMIIGLYLATPVLKQYVKNADTMNLCYFLCLWFVFTSLFPLLKRFFNISIGLQLQMVTGYAGYFILGYFLNQIKISGRTVFCALGSLLTGAGVTFFATAWMSLSNGNTFEEYFYDYMSPNVILLAVGIFILFRSIDFHSWLDSVPGLEKATVILSEASFGIYLVHVLVLELLEKGFLGIKISGLAFHPLFSIPLTSLVVMLLSLGLVALLKKIPLLRHIV